MLTMLNGTNNRVLGLAYTVITIPNVKRSNRKWTFSNLEQRKCFHDNNRNGHFQITKKMFPQ